MDEQSLPRLKLVFAYDGGLFMGWQRQVEHGVMRPTVEGALRDALVKLHAGEKTAADFNVQVAGRTDAGVHAVGQVCHVDGCLRRDTIKYLDGLNHYLPESVRVREVAWVSEDFHARFSAVWRRYRYVLYEGRRVRPDLRGRVGHVMKPLNVAAMQAALDMVGVGEINFCSLQDAECQSDNPVLQMMDWRIRRENEVMGEKLIALDVQCNRFLHHMVRNLMGTLVPIGQGERPVEWLADVLAVQDRTKAGVTFTPEGLYLLEVGYK